MNTLTLLDYLGFLGVTFMLIAYFLHLRNKIKSESFTYLFLNFIGATIACIASILLKYIPFIILEGCWSLISAYCLIFHFKNKYKQLFTASTAGLL